MNQRPRKALIRAALILCVGLATPPSARAQSVDPQRALAAQALYEQATAEMDAKSYASACRKLEEVTRIVPEALGAKLTLAECYEALGKLASAWSQYAQVEEKAAKVGETERAKAAAASAAALKPKLSTLAIEVPDSVRKIAGIVITRDGVPVGEPLWGVPLSADAGGHEVVAIAPGRRTWKGRVEIVANGVKVSIMVKPLELDPSATDSAAAAVIMGGTGPVRAWQKPLSIAAMGIGGAGVAFGALLGGLAIAKNGESNRENHCDARDYCDDIGLELRKTAVGLGNGSTAALAVGATALAGGLVLFATLPTSGAERSRTRAKLKGDKLSMTLELAAGLVNVKGAW